MYKVVVQRRGWLGVSSEVVAQYKTKAGAVNDARGRAKGLGKNEAVVVERPKPWTKGRFVFFKRGA